jgi:hypothetical protein
VIEDDDFAMAALRLLPPRDVGAARAQRLRERCHRELRKRTALAFEPPAAQLWRRVVGPALIGALSAIYLIETLRTAAALYGF